MVFARVFLILLVPLLVPGAPTGPVGPGGAILLNPTSNNQTPKQEKIWETPTAQTSREASSPPLSPHSAPSIHSTNANQSPLAESTHEHVETLSATTCVFQEGTWYLLLWANASPVHKLMQSKFCMQTDGIFFTQDNAIFVPKGITIESSIHISFKLPSGDTKVKVMDKSDPRLAKVGIFPEGSTYYKKKHPHARKELKSVVLKEAKIIIITPERRIFHLDGGNTVIVLPDILRLPPSGEETYFQEITKKDQTRIEEWCAETYAQNPELKYIDMCFETNLWHVWSPEFVKVRMKKKSNLSMSFR